MKRTAVLGGFLMLVMMISLGMSSQSNQTSCCMTCLAPCLQVEQSSSNLYIPIEGIIFSRINRDFQDRETSNRRLPRAKRGLDSSESGSMNSIEHFMAVATEIDPELAAQLKKICETDPEAFEVIIFRQRHRFGSLIRLQSSDPMLFELKVTELKTDAEIYRFTEQMRTLDFESPQAAAQMAQLKGLVSAKTKLSIKAQRLYIDRLEQHLQALRKRLEKSTKEFDSIVQDRVHQLVEIVQQDKRFELPRID